MDSIPEFELANVGPGPDPCTLSALAADEEFVLLLFQRSPKCTNCKKQVQAIAEQYEEFQARSTVVASILPGDRADAASWQDAYDLPYPLLADPEAATGDEYGQPVRFGLLGRLSDFLGRMPKAVLIDCRDDEPAVVWSHEGRSTFDRPDVEAMVQAVDDAR